MSDALSDAAKAEIAAAIRIVREDKFESFARERLAKHTEKPATEVPSKAPDPAPEVPPKVDPPVPPVVPPPKLPEVTPPEVPPKRVSRYWGELD